MRTNETYSVNLFGFGFGTWARSSLNKACFSFREFDTWNLETTQQRKWEHGEDPDHPWPLRLPCLPIPLGKSCSLLLYRYSHWSSCLKSANARASLSGIERITSHVLSWKSRRQCVFLIKEQLHHRSWQSSQIVVMKRKVLQLPRAHGYIQICIIGLHSESLGVFPWIELFNIFQLDHIMLYPTWVFQPPSHCNEPSAAGRYSKRLPCSDISVA